MKCRQHNEGVYPRIHDFETAKDETVSAALAKKDNCR